MKSPYSTNYIINEYSTNPLGGMVIRAGLGTIGSAGRAGYDVTKKYVHPKEILMSLDMMISEKLKDINAEHELNENKCQFHKSDDMLLRCHRLMAERTISKLRGLLKNCESKECEYDIREKIHNYKLKQISLQKQIYELEQEDLQLNKALRPDRKTIYGNEFLSKPEEYIADEDI